jgi:hypothetical protein
MKAHLLFIADGRSPTAQRWIANVHALGYAVSLVSTFPCLPPNGLRHFDVMPVALSRFSREPSTSTSPTQETNPPKEATRTLVRRFAPTLQALRYVLGPMTIPRFAQSFKRLIEEVEPDLVHALRIPFEGMLGSYTPADIPFIATTWGNDLTLHAEASPLMRRFTQRCLSRADGFTADTHRDVRLAQAWGLPADAPTLVVVGTGGLDLEAILEAKGFEREAFALPAEGNWVVNPRGLRPGSVHQDTFFAAIPAVLAQQPGTHFICPNLAGSDQVEKWVAKYDIAAHTHLLPKLPQSQLWSLYQQAQLYVSPSSHDGTPNSLLEAMACGCFPVVGDIESLREWIEQGENGLLFDPRDPQALAAAICDALAAPDLRQRAASRNLAIVKERASHNITQPQIDAFYQRFLA